jgi:hypothetical protein
VNLLNDVYAQGSISTALCRKHKLSNSTTRTLKDLKYCNPKGKSIMYERPSVSDAKKVIARNRIVAKKYNAERMQTQIKFDSKFATGVTGNNINNRPQFFIPQTKPIHVENTKTTEINLFWGMIKIKR